MKNSFWNILNAQFAKLAKLTKLDKFNKPSPRIILIAAVIVIALAVFIGLKACKKSPPATPVSVTTALPLSQEIRSFQTFDGLVNPYLTVNLDARVTGYLSKIGFADGAMVKKGDLLFLIEQDTYIQQVNLNQAIYNEAKIEYNRQKALLTENATSQAAVDKALSSLLQSEANLKLAKINLGYTEIRAPFDGLMGKHLLDVGTYLGNNPDGVHLATIQQISPIYVYFSVNERDYLKYQSSQKSSVQRKSEVNNLPVYIGLQDEIGYPHEGVLDYAANLVSIETGALQLRGIFQNKKYDLIPGLYTRVMVQYGAPRNALLLPLTAMLTDQQGNYVYVLDERLRAQRQNVQLGQRFEKYVEVSSGLSSNSKVVINGFINLSINQLTQPTDTTLEAMPAR
jgi:RND family efflux transporter MFP subunit